MRIAINKQNTMYRWLKEPMVKCKNETTLKDALNLVYKGIPEKHLHKFNHYYGLLMAHRPLRSSDVYLTYSLAHPNDEFDRERAKKIVQDRLISSITRGFPRIPHSLKKQVEKFKNDISRCKYFKDCQIIG